MDLEEADLEGVVGIWLQRKFSTLALCGVRERGTAEMRLFLQRSCWNACIARLSSL